MTIKQYGGVFGRNPTFNNVTIEGTLTFDGDIDINSDLTIEDNLYVLGSVGIGNTSPATALDVTGSVTADGLTVDGNARIEEIGAIAKLTLERGGSANAADSAAVDLLETNAGSEGANFGDAATNGFRLKLDGSANDFLIQSGASGTVNTRFGIDRDSGDISFYNAAGNSQALFWDASAESLGIGDTSPANGNLTIRAASTTGTKNGHIMLTGDSATNGQGPQIVFSESGISSNFAGASVGYVRTGSNGIGDLVFGTRAISGDADTVPTEAMRIDSSQNLLVGTTTTDGGYDESDGGATTVFTGASIGGAANGTAFVSRRAAPLQLNRQANDGDIAVFRKDGTTVGSIGSESGSMYIEGNPAAGKSGLTFFGSYIEPRDDGSPADNAIDLGSSDNRFKDLYLSGVSYNGDGSAAAPSISFGADTNTGFYRVGSDQIGFATAGTIKAKLDANGNWFVGGTSVGDSDSCAIESYGAITIARASGVGRIHMTFTNGGATVGTISTTGSATAYNTSSDQRLKENIADADDAGSKIDTIQVRKFDWKADGSHQDYGMVAQELLEVAPEAVSAPEDSEEMMGVDYSKLVPMMLKEIQSLRARVAQLES